MFECANSCYLQAGASVFWTGWWVFQTIGHTPGIEPRLVFEIAACNADLRSISNSIPINFYFTSRLVVYRPND